jgi:serine/threonine protein kinase
MAHKLSCSKLSQRCEVFLSPLPPSLSSQEPLLNQLLEEIDVFVKKFLKPEMPKPRSNNARPRGGNEATMSWFERVLDDQIPDLKSFQSFAEKIDGLQSDLRISPLNSPNHSTASPLTDCEDIRSDMESLFEEITSFQREGGYNFRVLQLISRCSSLLSRCHATNDQISQFQNQVAGMLKLSKSPTPVSTTTNNNNEGGEIRCQLTQIHHLIEDFINSNEIIPQQLALISNLNDSLVQSMNELHESILDIFSLELAKLRETTERFHNEVVLADSNPDTDRKLDEIRSLIEKESLSKKEEAIRQDRLSRLEKCRSKYTVDEDSFLGEGSFAKVRLGQYGNQVVAIKVIEVKGHSNSFSSSMKKAIENEVLLMSLCHHPCVLQIFGYCKVDPGTTHLILELGSMGSLWSVLENREKLPSIPLSLSFAWISDILCGLNYLHEQRILHQDMKAENVMLDHGFRCKLTDFGLSKQQMESSFGRQSSHHNQAGTLWFMAPEVLDRVHGRYSHRSDVYSCGVTCFQIFFRAVPSRTMNLTEITRLLQSVVSEEHWQEFVRGCLEENVSERLSSREALKLIGAVQRSERITGDPREPQSVSPAGRHLEAPEVEVMKKVWIASRLEETTLKSNPEAADLSRMVLDSSPPSSHFPLLMLCRISRTR